MEQSPVVSYYKRVGLLIDELTNYYTQVTRLLEFVDQPDSNLVGVQKVKSVGLIWGTRENNATFYEQMDLIKIYLKKIEGAELLAEEKVLFESTDSANSLIWNNITNYMEPLIFWLKSIIEYYSNK